MGRGTRFGEGSAALFMGGIGWLLFRVYAVGDDARRAGV
jgi:hypothetical protein